MFQIESARMFCLYKMYAYEENNFDLICLKTQLRKRADTFVICHLPWFVEPPQMFSAKVSVKVSIASVSFRLTIPTPCSLSVSFQTKIISGPISIPFAANKMECAQNSICFTTAASNNLHGIHFSVTTTTCINFVSLATRWRKRTKIRWYFGYFYLFIEAKAQQIISPLLTYWL